RRPDLGGGRARRRRGQPHPRRPGRRPPGARQGAQGAAGAARLVRPGRRHRLPGPRPPGARGPRLRLAGPVPRLPRRPAVPAERVGGAAGGGRTRRTGDRGLAAHAAALLRHPPAGRRGRRAGGAGAAGPRVGDHDADLHPRHRRPPARGVPDLPPARVL
ncbi:MAG: Site-specific tyrosine recombinase XerD, partial [uncultured Friedmanniella sp.]